MQTQEAFLNRTFRIKQPSDKDAEFSAWFQSTVTQMRLYEWLVDPTYHIVDGVHWSNGIQGSRWADTTINGRNVRIAFYSRYGDPKFFDSEFFKSDIEGKRYRHVIMVMRRQ